MKYDIGKGFLRKFAAACLLFLFGSMLLDIAILRGVIVGGFEWIVWGVLILLTLMYLFQPDVGGNNGK